MSRCTIASRPQPEGGVAVALTGAQLLQTVPGIDVDDVQVVDLVHGPSWNFDIDTMAAEGFPSAAHRMLVHVESDPSRLVEWALTHQPAPSGVRWVSERER